MTVPFARFPRIASTRSRTRVLQHPGRSVDPQSFVPAVRSAPRPAPRGARSSSDEPVPRVLLVEDSPGDAVIVRELLSRTESGYDLCYVETLAAGLERLGSEPFSIVLADLGLPDAQGLDTFRRLRAAAGDAPIVVLSGFDDVQMGAEAVREGAQDYLVKGTIDSPALERALRYAIERGRSARALEQSETLLCVAEEIARLGSWEWDARRKRMRWSDEMVRIHGLAHEEFDGTWEGMLSRVHAEDRDAVNRTLGRALVTAEPFELEHRIVRPDGSTRVVHCQGKIAVDGAGRPLRMVGAYHDVTERKRGDEALSAHAREQAVVADLGRKALGGLDIESLQREIVRQVTDVLRVDACEIVEFPSSRSVERSAFGDPAVASGGISVLVPGKDRLYGTLGVRSRARRQFPRDDVMFLQSVANILAEAIERKRVEDELRAARDEALRLARLKTAFLANVSHEIRTPVNVMLGYNSILEDGATSLDDASRASLFEGIRNAGLRLTHTIDGILDLSKIETRNFEIRPRMIVLGSFVERHVAEIAAPARAKGLDVTCVLRVPDAVIRFDEYCLSRALQNLLANALKFTERGGIVVKLDRDAQGALRLSIEDTGIGIDAGYLPRLFERFSQEEGGYGRRYEGTGLGLALVREYLELNGATIHAESRKGSGTRLEIRFANDGDVSGGRTGTGILNEDGETRRGALRILVVEDDPASQLYMRRILDSQAEVRVAADAAQVREQLALGPVELILMDLSLGGPADGLAITRELRADDRWRTVPIIATTAHAFPEDRRRSLAAGCSGYIAKPFRRADLLELIEEVLNREP